MSSGRAVSALLTAGHRVRRLWWRARKPQTFGVKVLLLHPEGPGRVLAVRHSYIVHDRWGLPGGCYRPWRESAHAAARREVREGLDLGISGELWGLATARGTLEGKRDTITLLAGTAAAPTVRTSIELRDARWTRTDLSDLPPGDPVSRWLRRALAVPRA